MDTPRTDDLAPIRNRLLRTLPGPDLDLLRPHLSPIDLELRDSLETANNPVENVYFFETRLASIVATGPSGRRIEVGIIGREGMTGLPIVYGDDRSPNETFVQAAGRDHGASSIGRRRSDPRGARTPHRPGSARPGRTRRRLLWRSGEGTESTHSAGGRERIVSRARQACTTAST